MLKPAVRVPDAGRWIKVDHAAGDVDRRQGIEKHDCRFAAEAVRDDLGLYVVTGHVGLFQRLHRANSELVCRRSNLAGHWARIGVVGVLRVRLARWSNYLARIIKRLL